MTPRYLLGSGYYHAEPERDRFINFWAQNLARFTMPYPQNIVIAAVGNSWTWIQEKETANLSRVSVIPSQGNLGHVHQILGKQEPSKPHRYCGWSASVMALAMLAYSSECDFVYREQDCLCFGDYIGEMYRQIGTRRMIFGSYQQDGRNRMPCAQSLFLIRHDFIPEFVRRYLSVRDDRDIRNLPEEKFASMERVDPRNIGRFSFGVDRGRPLPWDDKVWYAQKWTERELCEAVDRGLL